MEVCVTITVIKIMYLRFRITFRGNENFNIPTFIRIINRKPEFRILSKNFWTE